MDYATESEKKTCCICGGEFEGWGNNPDGAVWLDKDGAVAEIAEFGEGERCCDECNMKYVIPGRIYLLGKRRGQR